jgi:hypothetical protein
MMIDLYNSLAGDPQARISLVDVGLYHRWANHPKTHPSMTMAVQNMMRESHRLDFMSHTWSSLDFGSFSHKELEEPLNLADMVT